MKQIRIMTVVFTALMIAALGAGLRMEQSLDFQGRDISRYNDMLNRIHADARDGKTIGEMEAAYGCSIILSTDLVDAELTKYYASGALVLDYAPDGTAVGKVVWDDRAEAWDSQISRFRKTVLIGWGIMAAVGYILILLIWLTVVKPIREFEGFAESVARGNLEVQLPRRRLNLFGNFTESFDIMREELRAAREREVETARAKREMVAGLSHDIKTPAATIQAACEVLGEKYGDNPDIREKTAVISAKVGTINQLISNLFQSTLEELEELPVNPGEVSTKKIEGFFADMNQKGDIIAENSIPECLVYMDPIRMEQAVDNVISNSRKYAGTPIHVAYDQVDGVPDETGNTGQFIRITVRDEGPGVPEEDLARITEKYFRGSNAGSQVGYGLGMYLVKWYMEKQGGGMEYYNDDGFVVELLLKKV